jgi:hypothetical protein
MGLDDGIVDGAKIPLPGVERKINLIPQYEDRGGTMLCFVYDSILLAR